MFRGGSTYAQSYADIDGSFEATNSFRQGSAGGRYIAHAGDTLGGIAQAVYGDSSLWYKIAEANALSADATLVEGQSLSLPGGVTRSKNNASTFKPYDPAETLGDFRDRLDRPRLDWLLPSQEYCRHFRRPTALDLPSDPYRSSR